MKTGKYKQMTYKPVACADGFTMSVQARDGLYCSPRYGEVDRYTQVEIGYPSAEEALLMQYAEDRNRPTDTVYAYVPVPVVTLVLAKHGGIIDGELPPGIPYLRAIKKQGA